MQVLSGLVLILVLCPRGADGRDQRPRLHSRAPADRRSHLGAFLQLQVQPMTTTRTCRMAKPHRCGHPTLSLLSKPMSPTYLKATPRIRW